jgi:type VI secretion system protein ImpH
MPTAQRPQPVGVIDRLLEEPHRFGFFQAVRLLERWFVQQEGLQPSDVLGKRLQFRNSLSMAFPASEIAEFNAIAAQLDRDQELAEADSESLEEDRGIAPVRQSKGISRVELTPAFMGLLGVGGTLPAFYTELFAQRELYQKDSAGRAFMDIFLHRAVVLFYQAWRKHRLAIQFEADRKNHFLPMLLAVAGVGHASLRDRLQARDGGVSDDTLAYFSGMLQQRPVSALVLQRVLAQHFAVPVKLEQFVGRWFSLPADNQTALGGPNTQLGFGAVVGERIWQRDLRMRLTLGPMPRDKFSRFLPGGPGALALRELLTMMTGVTLEYEVRLALRAQDVRGVSLGGSEGGARLGWDGFLATRAANEDRADAGYDIHAIA